jgi:hypothetical protein
MSALVRLNDGTEEKHTFMMALAIMARKEGKIVDAAYHMRKKRTQAALAKAKAELAAKQERR